MGLVEDDDRVDAMLAVNLLRGELAKPVTLVVVERRARLPDLGIHPPDLAVIGIWAGAWTEAIDERVPNGSRVVLRSDHDESGAGDRYAAKVGATLEGRVTLLRSKPTGTSPEPDENDRHMAGTLPDDPTEATEPYAPPARVEGGA